MFLILFKTIFLTTIWVLAIKIATAKGMVFEKFGYWVEDKVDVEGKKMYELLRCPYCMPSVHSIIGFGFAYLMGVWNVFEWKLLLLYVLNVFGTSLVAGTIWSFHDLIINANKFYHNLNEQSDEYQEQEYLNREEQEIYEQSSN